MKYASIFLGLSSLVLTACGNTVLGGGGGTGQPGSTGPHPQVGLSSSSATGTGGAGTGGAGAAGTGGAWDAGPPGTTGAGGAVTAPPPPPCGRTGVNPGTGDGSPPAELAWYRYGMAAHWTGLAQPPHGWTGPGFPDTLWSVDVTFSPDGHYTGRCLETECVAFYYGSDADDPGKTYELDDINAALQATGTLQVYFGPNDYNTADITVTLSSDLSSMKMSFTKNGYGPVVYELSCTP